MTTDNFTRLIDAIYVQAIEDIIKTWRFHKRHGKKANKDDNDSVKKRRNETEYYYSTSISFLKSTEKGKRILKALLEVDEDGYERLLKHGLSLNPSNRDEQEKVNKSKRESY